MRRLWGWAWRSLSVGCFRVGAGRCGWRASISGGLSALDSHVYRLARQGWLPSLFNETMAPLTGVGSAIPSFPFVEMHHRLEQRLPRGVIHQLVMMLVSRLHMSVPEIIMAYALVS